MMEIASARILPHCLTRLWKCLQVFENLGKEDEYGKGPRKLRRKMPRKGDEL